MTRTDTLTEAVLKQLGGDEDENRDTLRDVDSHGADAGFPGFTYYSDTCAFYEANKDAIWDLLGDEAEMMGQTPLAYLADFGGAKDVQTATQLENLLAWYALEHVARAALALAERETT